MGLVKHVEVRMLDSIKSGMVEFYSLQSSDETVLAQIPAGLVDDLFVHHFQTDQLLVVRGSFVLVVLQNKQYNYIPLSEHQPQVVTIPPGVPHGAINLSTEPCLVVNAVIRHGVATERDYRPLRLPYPFDIAKAQALLESSLIKLSLPS